MMAIFGRWSFSRGFARRWHKLEDKVLSINEVRNKLQELISLPEKIFVRLEGYDTDYVERTTQVRSFETSTERVRVSDNHVTSNGISYNSYYVNRTKLTPVNKNVTVHDKVKNHFLKEEFSIPYSSWWIESDDLGTYPECILPNDPAKFTSYIFKVRLQYADEFTENYVKEYIERELSKLPREMDRSKISGFSNVMRKKDVEFENLQSKVYYVDTTNYKQITQDRVLIDLRFNNMVIMPEFKRYYYSLQAFIYTSARTKFSKFIVLGKGFFGPFLNSLLPLPFFNGAISRRLAYDMFEQKQVNIVKVLKIDPNGINQILPERSADCKFRLIEADNSGYETSAE